MRSRRSYGAPVAAMGLDADALLWRDAVVTNGGSVSAARLAVVSAFIIAEKAAGIWALTDDYWVFWAENAIQALTSLKQLRLATAVNSPVFTEDRGYAFDGTTNYINTGFIPSTHAVAMTGTSLGLAVYERTNIGISRYHGAYSTTTRSLYFSPRTGSSVYVGGANGESGAIGSVSDSRGLTAVEQSSGTVGFDKNGVGVATSTPSVGSVLPAIALYLGAYNNAGSAAGFRAVSVGFALARAGSLSPTQKLAQYSAIQAFATAVGAQV